MTAPTIQAMPFQEERPCANVDCRRPFVVNSHHHRFCGARCKDAARRKTQAALAVSADCADVHGVQVGDGDQREQPVDTGVAAREATRRLEKVKRQLAAEKARTALIVELVREQLELGAADTTPWDLEPIRSGGGEPSDAHAVLCDTQAGKLVGHDGIATLQAYMQQWVLNVVRRVRQQQKHGRVESLTVWLLGDLVENCGMFPTQAYELDYKEQGHLVIVQVMTMVRLLREALAHLKALRVPITLRSARGNHGRRSPRRDVAASAVDDNLDTLVGLIVQELVGGVDYDVPIEGWSVSAQSQGYTIVGAHGDQIPGNTPATFEKWVLNHDAAGTWGRPDVVLLAHRHHPMTLDVGSGITVIQSGAMDGGSPWFHERFGKLNGPVQEMFFVSEGQGVHTRHPIFLTPPLPRAARV